jgi:hypothetical protein
MALVQRHFMGLQPVRHLPARPPHAPMGGSPKFAT